MNRSIRIRTLALPLALIAVASGGPQANAAAPALATGALPAVQHETSLNFARALDTANEMSLNFSRGAR